LDIGMALRYLYPEEAGLLDIENNELRQLSEMALKKTIFTDGIVLHN